MTEAEWLTSVDPVAMLSRLGKIGRRPRRVSVRKLRLIAAACARHAWRLLSEERSRAAVVAAEREEMTDQEIEIARAGADYAQYAIWHSRHGPSGETSWSA